MTQPPSANRPDPIQRTPGGFVDYTVTQRLPKVVSDAEALIAAHGDLAAAKAMLQSVLAADEIHTEFFARPTPYWQTYLDRIGEVTWGDLPFFDLEFLFYHGLNSIAGYFDNGVDIFQQTRQSALAEALPSLDVGLKQIAEQSEVELLRSVFRYSLFANEADYSQLATSRSDATLWGNRTLIDQTDEFITHLTQKSDRTADAKAEVHIIADNAGHELCWDLIATDAILRLFPQLTVILHLKPWPMFVSDALESDVEATLTGFEQTAAERVHTLGLRLRSAIANRRLCLQSEPDWGEPRHFNHLDTDLETTLCQARAVIAKGDLNYRRFIQDLQWPAETSVAVATAAVPFEALALRVLKSDAVVGMPPSTIQKAAAEYDDWKTRGHFAIVQIV